MLIQLFESLKISGGKQSRAQATSKLLEIHFLFSPLLHVGAGGEGQAIFWSQTAQGQVVDLTPSPA